MSELIQGAYPVIGFEALWRVATLLFLGLACAGLSAISPTHPSRMKWGAIGFLPAATAAVCLGWISHEGTPKDIEQVVFATNCAIVALGGALAARISRQASVQQTISRALDVSGEGIVVLDGRDRVVETNATARQLLWPNVKPNAPLVLQKALQVLLHDTEKRRHSIRAGAHRLLDISISGESTIQSSLARRALLVRDITTLRRGQKHLLRLAHRDSLTGLINRRRFLERLENVVRDAQENEGRVALFYIDLDRFKEVNDTMGHGAGDELLRTVATRFEEYFRLESDEVDGPGASIARLGGDEFAIIVPNIESEEAALEIAEAILTLIAEPMRITERSVTSSGSVGIAMLPDHGSDVEEIVKHADSALYAAKRMGRARSAIYEASFSSETERSRRIEEGLRHAIEREELSLHYQPKVDLESQTVGGFEALLRWNSAELGLVGPAGFIPIAEERGLICEIGEWCIDETCRQIRSWMDAGYNVVPISVNVSSPQFRESNLEIVISEALKRHGIPPFSLEIELTESLLLSNDDSTALALRNLRAIGVRIALDDFGTGYSALTYLSKFPLDVVKMDRGFLRDIHDDDAAAGITSAVVAMAHSIGLEVVAEGVDSMPQVALLREMKCDQLQGFLFSPAIPAAEATRFLATEDGDRPFVEPVASLVSTIEGSSDAPSVVEDKKGSAPLDLPSMRTIQDEERRVTRLLMLDETPSKLGLAPMRAIRLGADTHLVTGIDEAQLFVTTEQPSLDLVIAPPSIDLDSLATTFEFVKKNAIERRPRLLILGEEPDPARRDAIREMGADWVLWEPYEDADLVFLIQAARNIQGTGKTRHWARAPIETMAWLGSGNQREPGMITSLSSRGGFIETPQQYPVGRPIRIEFELPDGRVRAFANVSYREEGDADEASPRSPGIGVIFYDLDDYSTQVIDQAIDQRCKRYEP